MFRCFRHIQVREWGGVYVWTHAHEKPTETRNSESCNVSANLNK